MGIHKGGDERKDKSLRICIATPSITRYATTLRVRETLTGQAGRQAGVAITKSLSANMRKYLRYMSLFSYHSN